MYTLADVYFQRGRYTESRSTARSWKRKREVLGENHPSTLYTADLLTEIQDRPAGP